MAVGAGWQPGQVEGPRNTEHEVPGFNSETIEYLWFSDRSGQHDIWPAGGMIEEAMPANLHSSVGGGGRPTKTKRVFSGTSWICLRMYHEVLDDDGEGILFLSSCPTPHISDSRLTI